MDEITDQFRTEDAEEFKQLQAELEVAGALPSFPRHAHRSLSVVAKNCRILQFKLRKAEKRNENMEGEKVILEGTIDFGNFRVITGPHAKKLMFCVCLVERARNSLPSKDETLGDHRFNQPTRNERERNFSIQVAIRSLKVQSKGACKHE